MLMLVPSLTSAQPGEWTKPTPPVWLDPAGLFSLREGEAWGRFWTDTRSTRCPRRRTGAFSARLLFLPMRSL